MKLEPFVMERWQSEWENRVAHNLSESGVHPLRVDELITPEEGAQLLAKGLSYGQSNGSEELRAVIASTYPGAEVPNIVVTNGSAEANFISVWRIVEPGDEVVVMLPNYMQIPGIVRAFGAKVVPLPLREDGGWALDEDALQKAVTAKTRLICVCNPNNPTGAILSEAEMKAIVDAASRHGSWILADEVYRGAERVGPLTPTFWGRYDRLLATCGLSKAYALPGLRIGWVASPAPLTEELWARKDYTTIFPSLLSDFLAQRAVARREQIFERTRAVLRANYPVVEEWLKSRGSMFGAIPPKAGAFAYLRYGLKMNSTELVTRLKDEHGVLIVPGDQFGMDGFLRLGFGNEPPDLRAGLSRIDAFLSKLAA